MTDIDKLAGLFKAFSDPTRLKLIRLLVEHRGAICVMALAGSLGVSQSAVSQHLRVLRQAGLVKGQRLGNHVHYTIDRERIEEFRAAARDILGEELTMI